MILSTQLNKAQKWQNVNPETECLIQKLSSAKIFNAILCSQTIAGAAAGLLNITLQSNITEVK